MAGAEAEAAGAAASLLWQQIGSALDPECRRQVHSVHVPDGMKEHAKRLIGPRATVQLRSLLRGQGLPRWGNLRSTAPFSATYGFERRLPIDRYYLHRFLHAHL